MRLELTILIALALAPAFGWAQMAQSLQPAAVQTADPVAEMLEAEAPEVELVLVDPPTDILASGDMAAVPAITVSDIRIRGNRALSNEELAAITAEYEGRNITVEELHGLRQRLSRAYFDQGYVNSGVIIPDQQVADGIITLQVIEGELSGIVIEGNQALSDSYLRQRITRTISDPLNISDLQTSLRLLLEDPLVSSVNAQLVPGDTPGSGRLDLTINEEPPFELIIAADNHISPSVAEERGTIYLAHRSLFGRGDIIAGRFGLTQGVQDQGISYSFPVSALDTRIEGYYSNADSEILEKPFDTLDINSEVESLGIVISHPFIRRLDRRFKVSLGFENKRSESTLLGFPFSFSAGEVDGKAEASALYLAGEWMQRRERSVFAARVTYNHGVGAFGASKSDIAPDSRFDMFVGQLEYIRNMGWRESRFIAKSTFQLTNDPLLAMYKLGVGGRYTVRGYRENLFVRDNGVTASLEYQFPLFVDETGRDKYNLSLATFADWGRSWDEDDALPTSSAETIASVGLGALWTPIEGLYLELYWGNDLDDQKLPNDTWQDRGFHYQVSYQAHF